GSSRWASTRGRSPCPMPRSASWRSSRSSARDGRSARRGAAPEVGAQRAVLAARRGPAVRLADRHEQCVKLVEQNWIRGQMRLKPRAGLFVARGPADQAVAREDPARVRIGAENRAGTGGEKDG